MESFLFRCLDGKMKRSEMITKLAIAITGKYSWDGKELEIPLEYADHIANIALTKAEDLGMLPPPSRVDSEITDGVMYVYYHDGQDCFGEPDDIYLWEPE